MSTGGRFCLQECERRRIIIGEEVSISTDNVDRIKELMSGETTTCERKGRSCVKCKASLVLMNANVVPGSSVPSERQALLNRMMIRNLRPSHILPSALENTIRSIHRPRVSHAGTRETPQNDFLVTKGPHPRTYLYQESWEQFIIDHINGIGQTPSPPPPPATAAAAVDTIEPITFSELFAASTFADATHHTTTASPASPDPIFYSCESVPPPPPPQAETATTAPLSPSSFITPYTPSPYSMPSCMLEYQRVPSCGYTVDEIEASVGTALEDALNNQTITTTTTTSATSAAPHLITLTDPSTQEQQRKGFGYTTAPS
ncbi:hypothetical protein RRG08_063732 [Elysia crispata]|uniref:Uncharacterized protein n=1 Tax=Elysia crispata TaxID=231223 RepID=A0AAE1DMM4_9GAST|nr:hypothetical protein RRG08_063732 [Elysia crispata]